MRSFSACDVKNDNLYQEDEQNIELHNESHGLYD